MSTFAALRPGRLSIRIRLTLLYGGLVLASGIVLLVIVYLLMRYIPTYDLRPGAPAVNASPDGVTTTAVPALPVGVIRPVPTITSESDVLTVLLRLSGVALAGVVLVAFGLGWIIAGRILAPVHRITRTARTIAGRTLHERIRLDGPRDEFTELADTIDTMLDRLHASFQAQQRFAANASHELRTPLATTRTMLQVAIAHPDGHDLPTLASKLLATNERSIATVEALLTLANADHGLDAARPVDLTALAAAALDLVRAEADGRAISVQADLLPVRVEGDADLLHHLLINLLHNAIRHNHPGGSARLTVGGPNSAGGTAAVTVVNTGEVITAEAAGRFFEPFHRQRTRTSAGGHGLGLTLVRAIAHSHHGTVAATPAPGGGLTITVTLPMARDQRE